MKTNLIQVEGEQICKLTLNRPDAANAMSSELLDHLASACQELMHRDDVHVVIISSSGEKSFCAGADLKERAKMSQEQARKAVKRIGEVIEMVANLPQPVIIEANGHAFGGGLELSLAGDIRVFSEDSLYGLTETSLAIIPGAGGTQRLPRLIGESRAKELIYTARRFNGKDALAYGICEYAVPHEEVAKTAMELALKISANGPIAVRAAKYAIESGRSLTLEEGLVQENIAYERTINTKDRMEGLTAFKEKRKPHYQGH
nr:enoyl-CoA hydratase-related protein [Shouchella xiaoxiensis]